MATFEAVLLVVLLLVLLVLAALIVARKMAASSKLTGGGERRSSKHRSPKRRSPESPPIEMFIQEPWFGYVLNGTKSVEGRAAKEGRWRPHINKIIVITNKKTGESVRVRITGVRHYTDLETYLDAEWEKAAPQCSTREEAHEAYRKVRMNNDEQVFSEARVRERGGMVAIEMELVD